MASLRGVYGKKEDEGINSNFNVDYVIKFNVPKDARSEAEASYVQLIEALTNVGLATEVRVCDAESLLVFVKIASHKLLAEQAFRSRLQDWLHGIRTAGAGKDVTSSLRDEPVNEAERLRILFLMITKPKNDGGAGIAVAAKSGPWRFVDSIFPLHNHQFNKVWIKKWSTKYLLEQEDLDEIRDRFGESVAFYFAFTQAYFRFLVFPAAFGFAAWLLFGQFSFLYALMTGLWSIVFFEYWKQKEVDLAVQWGVRGVSAIQHPRPEFEFTHEQEDVVTGEPVRVYSPWKRLQTQLLQIPFAVACTIVLGGFIVMCNSLEIFINEVYTGPGKMFLPFLPTILLVTILPTFSTILTRFAGKLNHMENYETMDDHQAALIQKHFVLNFITSYMPLAFTAFVYIPFGHVLTPYLNFWRATAEKFTFGAKELSTKDFTINPERISKQMFYFTVTAQIVNFATEVVVPYLKRKGMDKAKETGILKGKESGTKDHEEEAAFLSRVRAEAELEVYDVAGDYREMVIQFGYLALFSVAWPLAGCAFFINNWVELRSDALKIAIGSRRPIPWRTDSIGPWLNALGFLSWLGSLTSSAIVFLCSGNATGSTGAAANVKAGGLLLSVLFAEHFYLVVQMVVRFIMGKMDSPGLQKERKERFSTKKRLLQEHLGQDTSATAAVPGISTGEKITKEALEEEARQASIKGQGTAEEMFWQRQRGMSETIEVGRALIAQAATNQTNKAAKA